MTPRLPLIACGVAALLAIPACDALDTLADARARMGARLRTEAARGGVLIETLAADPAAPAPLTRLTLRASGSEKALVAFADGLERGRPALRMQAWRLSAAPGGVRLDATLVAPWRG